MINRVVTEIRSDNGLTRVTIAGTIDEDADLSPLAQLSGSVELDLAGVRRINSIGIRDWIDAMRALSERCSVSFVRCSRAIVEQLNMIHGFLEHHTVRSFFAPMRCEACDRDVDQLFDRQEVAKDGLPEVPCPSCGVPMELDEIEDTYLHFIREPTKVS